MLANPAGRSTSAEALAPLARAAQALCSSSPVAGRREQQLPVVAVVDAVHRGRVTPQPQRAVPTSGLIPVR